MSGNKAFIDTSAVLRLLVKDDPAKARAVERLLKGSKEKGIVLYVLPVTILEIVWVTEKVYRLSRKAIRELIEAILNTPELNCSLFHLPSCSLSSFDLLRMYASTHCLLGEEMLNN